jgi:hypothetical protein
VEETTKTRKEKEKLEVVVVVVVVVGEDSALDLDLAPLPRRLARWLLRFMKCTFGLTIDAWQWGSQVYENTDLCSNKQKGDLRIL